jgi:hypothetical protein
MKLILPVTIVLGVLTSACHKEAEAPSSTIEADFELLNTQGQSATSFRQGQNIVFRFRVKNNTSDDVLLTNPLFETTHFLEVSKISAGNTSTVVGKPYKYVFCSYMGGYPVQANNALVMTIPWVEDAAYPTSEVFCKHSANSYLPAGRYKCSFTTELKLDNNTSFNKLAFTSAPQTFTKEFDVL